MMAAKFRSRVFSPTKWKQLFLIRMFILSSAIIVGASSTSSSPSSSSSSSSRSRPHSTRQRFPTNRLTRLMMMAHARSPFASALPLPLPLAFTTSRLEKEEEEYRGIWVDMKEEEESYNFEEDEKANDWDDEFECEDSMDDYDYGYDSRRSTRRRRRRRPKLYRDQKQRRGQGIVLIDDDGKEEEEKEEEEHPMRTDEWLVRIKLSPLLLPGNNEIELFPGYDVSASTILSQTKPQRHETTSKKKKEQFMKFARNGYVVLVEDVDGGVESDDDTDVDSSIAGKDMDADGSNSNSNRGTCRVRKTKIGKWKVDTAGVSWDIPVRLKSSDGMNSPTKSSLSSSSSSSSTEYKQTTLHYHADLVLTKFKERPRMFRGVVCRDRFEEEMKFSNFPWFNIPKNALRPVIATFTAEGIGVDTADVSYKKRGFGLSGGNG